MINVRGRTSKTKGYMTEENNLKPDGLAGTLYTQEMFAEWGYEPSSVEMFARLANDESFPEELRCAAIRYVALQAQSVDAKLILTDDPDFESLKSKYHIYPFSELT